MHLGKESASICFFLLYLLYYCIVFDDGIYMRVILMIIFFIHKYTVSNHGNYDDI